MSIGSVMPPDHLVLCHPLLLLCHLAVYLLLPTLSGLKQPPFISHNSADGWVILARLAWAQSYGGIQRVGWLGNCYSWDDKPFSALGFHF